MSKRTSQAFDSQPPSDPAASEDVTIKRDFLDQIGAALSPAGQFQPGDIKPAPATKRPRAPKPITLDFEFTADDKATIGLAIMLHHAMARKLGKTTPAEDGQALVEMVKAWYKPAADALAEKGIIS